MVTIKEQGQDEHGFVQKVNHNVGLTYPDVSSCITLTGVDDNYLYGAHVSIPAFGNLKADAVCARINSVLSGVKLKTFFIIGWQTIWEQAGQGADMQAIKRCFINLITGDTYWSLDIEKVAAIKDISSKITFFSDKNLVVEVKWSKDAQYRKWDYNWGNPTEKDRMKLVKK